MAREIKNIRVSISLPIWLAEDINEYAHDARITRSAAYRLALEAFLEYMIEQKNKGGR